MKTPCKHPGCPALLSRAGYCEAHQNSAPKRGENYQRHRRTDPMQKSIDAIRSGARWQKARALKLATHPLCEDPFGDHVSRDRTATATQVHHIVGLKEIVMSGDLERAFADDNLMSVCARCHSRLEGQVRRGE